MKRDVVVTVVVATVLALAFMYVLLTVAFSGWGDHFPEPSQTPVSLTVPSFATSLLLGSFD